MVIHIRNTDGSGTSKTIEQLVEKRYGKAIVLGKQLIGWNLNDTVVIRSEGLSQSVLQKYVRHFATQRHVIFEDVFPAANIDPYVAMARELRDYLFAFMDTSLRENWLTQVQLKQRFQSAACQVVTLRPARSLQQLEVLLLSAKMVHGSSEPLVLPKMTLRRSQTSTLRKAEKAA
jgi:hypothetical protein